jgi:hypothetical protein
MFNQNLLKPNTIDILKDDFLRGVKHDILTGTLVGTSKNAHAEFKDYFTYYVKNNQGFTLDNIDQYKHQDVIVGCHHYLDGLLIKHGKDLQVLEHDYGYYNKLVPGRQWSQPGELEPNKPLVIATPFPGYLGIHPQYEEILDEAEEKNIPIHLDGAWLSCSTGIEIDLEHSAIASVGISLSKGYSASWNRIGVRYTRTQDPTDPITIYNRVNMCPDSCVINGTLLLENVPMDYMWNTYGDSYRNAVEHFNLELGNILFAAYGKDRIIYSLSKLLTNDR